ncbi:MAG: phosphoglycolate phosphatase [Planctomycetota bacterium]|jgi:phosphoglycolate phosphatase
MTYQGIVFDKDGTLLDFNKTWLPIYRIAAAEYANGDAILAEHLLNQHGFDSATQRFLGGSLLAAGNNDEIAEAWSIQLNRQQEIETISLRLNQIFHVEGNKQATAVDLLAPTLNTLKLAGIKLGVATADSYQGILNTLEHFNVLDKFDFLAGYDSGYGKKPGGGMVTEFCRQLELDPASVIVVGDNRHDIEMGRNANAGLCVGVLTGTSTRVELEAVADMVFDTIGALPEYLETV